MLYSALLTTFGSFFRLIGATVVPFGMLILFCAWILVMSAGTASDPYFTAPPHIERVPLDQVPDEIKSGYLPFRYMLSIFTTVATAAAAIATPVYSVILGLAFQAPAMGNWFGYASLVSFGLILTLVTVRLMLTIDPLGESPPRSVKTSLYNAVRLYLYSLVVSVIGVFVLLVPSLVAVTTLAMPAPGKVNAAIVTVIILSVLAAGYIRCRLWVALPGIALGERPSFLQLWKRGRKLAVPLLLNNLLLSIIIALGYSGLVFAGMFEAGATWLSSFSNETLAFVVFMLASFLAAATVTIAFNTLHIEAYNRMRRAEIEAT